MEVESERNPARQSSGSKEADGWTCGRQSNRQSVCLLSTSASKESSAPPPHSLLLSIPFSVSGSGSGSLSPREKPLLRILFFFPCSPLCLSLCLPCLFVLCSLSRISL